MTNNRLAISSLLILFSSWCYCQSLPFSDNLASSKVQIPFEYHNDFIIVQVLFNGILPLNFIFDTGAEHTIITKREVTDILQVNYGRRFEIRGADMETVLYAYLATGVTLQMDRFVATNRAVLVLEEDVFRFEELAGKNIQGILGADIFRRFVVKIDYRKRVITFTHPNRFAPPEKFTHYPIEVEGNKSYLQAALSFSRDTSFQAKLLLDSGAGLALLLYSGLEHNTKLPDQLIRSNIGVGLGGYLEGFLGRVQLLELGEFSLEGVLTNFQELKPDIDMDILHNRDGILGNVVLSRFTVIIDYTREHLYLKPNREFTKKFKYDRSGLQIVATGPDLTDYIVIGTIEDSPADKAGIVVGDRILKLNGWPISLISLDGIYRRLRKREGKRIKMRILRDEEAFTVTFRLKKLI